MLAATGRSRERRERYCEILHNHISLTARRQLRARRISPELTPNARKKPMLSSLDAADKIKFAIKRHPVGRRMTFENGRSP